VPPGYTGPTAILKDSVKALSTGKVDFFFAESIEPPGPNVRVAMPRGKTVKADGIAFIPWCSRCKRQDSLGTLDGARNLLPWLAFSRCSRSLACSAVFSHPLPERAIH
jgi:hypothetical protein